MATHGNARPTSAQRFAKGFWLPDFLETHLLFAESISFLGEWEPALQSHKLTGPAPKQLLTTGQPTLKDRLGPVFQRFLDLVQELVGDGAVHHAVVVAE